MSVNAKRNGTLVGGLLIMLCVGILYMWSIFQPYVVEHHGWAVGDVAMTSALMIACFVIGNILGGLVQMKFDPRAITLVGCLMFVGGIYLTSCIGNGNPWMLYLSYSVCSGLGCGFAYCTVLYALQKWFADKNGLITGITVFFFGASVMVLSPVVNKMLENLGLTETFRILAIVFGVITVICSFFVVQPDPSYYMEKASKVLNADEFKQFTPSEVLRTPIYYCQVVSMILSSGAYLVIIPFIKDIAMDRGMSSHIGVIAVMVTGAANAAGRILAPMVSDKLGRTRSIIACCVISALACVGLIFANTAATYLVAIFLVAFAYGGTSGINPVISTELFGAKNSGTNYGLVMISIAISSVLFGKISASAAGSSFTPIFILCAAVCVVPVVLMSWLHWFCGKAGKNI